MEVTLRSQLQPGDLGNVVRLHGVHYASEHGFDATFEAYVAKPLADFALQPSLRQRLWLAEADGDLLGCIAIVPGSPDAAQLRWYLVVPAARGRGLGTRLLREAVVFSRDCGYRSIFLWTVHQLQAAAKLYRAAGFRLVEERPGRCWGVEVIEERYELELAHD